MMDNLQRIIDYIRELQREVSLPPFDYKEFERIVPEVPEHVRRELERTE